MAVFVWISERECAVKLEVVEKKNRPGQYWSDGSWHIERRVVPDRRANSITTGWQLQLRKTCRRSSDRALASFLSDVGKVEHIQHVSGHRETADDQ